MVPFGDGTEIIKDLNSSLDIHVKQKLLRRAQRYTVNLYENMIKKLEAAGAVYPLEEVGAIALKEEYYDEKMGVSLIEKYDSSDYIL